MRSVALLSLVILGLAVSVSGRALELGDKDFTTKGLKSGKNIFVKFLAPW